jgi:hypothetical protein
VNRRDLLKTLPVFAAAPLLGLPRLAEIPQPMTYVIGPHAMHGIQVWDLIRVDSEIVLVTGIDDDTGALSVVRNFGGTY